MHGEVREQDDKVLLHSDDQAGVALVTAGDHLHVVAHPEILLELVSRELQRILQRRPSTGHTRSAQRACTCAHVGAPSGLRVWA